MEDVFSHVHTAYQSFHYGTAFSVFAAYLIVDALFARYTLDVANLNELQAANVGVLTHFLLAFGVISYTQNWLYIFPLVIGSWIGTFSMIRRERLKRGVQKTNITI